MFTYSGCELKARSQSNDSGESRSHDEGMMEKQDIVQRKLCENIKLVDRVMR
jgi:hypothetical protein